MTSATSSTSYLPVARRLGAVVDAVPATVWSSPTPCEGWAAVDLLGHLIETQRDFLTGRGLDLGPAPDLSTDPAAAWHRHAEAVGAALTPEVLATGFDGHFGPTTVGATLEQFYVWDMVVHRWDLATAAGLADEFSADELDRIEGGADSFGDALYMEGVCKRREVPADADRPTRLLARLGRAA